MCCVHAISAIPGSDCVDPGGDQCYQVPSRFVSVDSGRQTAMPADPLKLLALPEIVTLRPYRRLGVKTEGSPTGNPSPAPGTRTARTARTTRQINGA